MTQSSLRFVAYGMNSRASVAMISRKYFGNYGNNNPARGGSTFAIHPVGSSQPRMSKNEQALLLTQRAPVENDELIDHLAETKTGYDGQQDLATMILERLNTSGVQQAHREDRISFTALTPWPGDLICAEGRYVEGEADTGTERRAGTFIGPEFGTVSRADLVAAAREAADADFDVLIAGASSYEAHATEFSKLGRIPILKTRMNADLHMAGDLKNTGKGNLFVIFGEPDIEIIPVHDNGTQARQIQVKVNGVDVFHPNTGEIRSDGPDGIACWFVDTDYTKRASSSATATSSKPTTPTRRSRPPSRPRSTATPGKPCTATPPGPSTAPPPAASPSK